jgi:signal peptidase I
MERKEVKINLFSLISTTFWVLLIVVSIVKLVAFQQVKVAGRSMMPQYQDGETLLVNQIDKNFRRGQVVAVYEDRDLAKEADYFTRFKAVFYLKRIIGMPGEQIEMYRDKVIIYSQSNPEGIVIEEDYIAETVKKVYRDGGYYFGRYTIPEKHFFLLGDNRNNSKDSREMGAFPDYALFGQETMRLWPVNRMELFSLPNYTFSALDEGTKIALESVRRVRNLD